MLIRTMGLFWKRDDVFWGRQRAQGRLLGVSAKSKKSGNVDFWNQVGVYVLYSNYHLIYVGQTGIGNQRLGVRLRQHTKDDLAGRWDSFSWFGVCYVKTNNELSKPPKHKATEVDTILNLIEGVLIEVAEPPLNRQHGRFGGDVERFLQVRDERLDGEE